MAKRATALSSQPARSVERALSLHREGRLDEADRIYGAVLSADPQHFAALHLSGLVKHQQGRLAEALRLVAAALKAKPGSTHALANYGMILDALGRHEEALVSFDRVLATGAADAILHYNRGNALKHLGRHADALASYDRALALAPGLVEAHGNRGNTLAALDRYEEAVASYDRALALAPRRADIHANRGNALLELRRFDDALACHNRALALRPNDADTLCRRGVALMELARHDEALADYARALAVAPDFAPAHLQRGNAFLALNRMDEALTNYAAAIAVSPNHPEANFNEALTRLCIGDFREGWRQYEYRWQRPKFAAQRPNYPQPIWRGEKDLRGKVVLLCAEQGMGDAIQFVRYAPLVAALGAKVVLGVHHPLKAVMATVPGISQVVSAGETLPDFDLYCPLLSLPLAFETEVATIPAQIPYIRPNEERIAKWRPRLPQSGRLRIGICWAGTSAHMADRRRSIPLERFATLLSVQGVDFISLQKDVDTAQAAILRDRGVVALGQEFEDFTDTAAVVAMLDLVISVDTSVAHLAGAMGKAVGLLVAFSPDWRWMLDRTDSPWYPTMRLFRQTTIGDWDGPLERMRRELAELI